MVHYDNAFSKAMPEALHTLRNHRGRAVAWVYVIPILMALISVAMVFLAVQSWKQYYWGKGRRWYYSLTAGVAIAYTLFLAAAGQLTVFFY